MTDIRMSQRQMRSASLAIWTAAFLSTFGAEQNIPARVPWTTANVRGTPEPASRYVLERAFPKLMSFDRPDDIAFAPGTGRIFITTEKGKLYSFRNDPNVERFDLFFDPAEVIGLDKLPDCKGVDTVVAITFHPKFEQNRFCYVQYNLGWKGKKKFIPDGWRVSRFTVTNTEPPRLDPKSEVIILRALGGGHGGCTLKFGPDGYLYTTLGDGDDPNPPDSLNTGQDISDLLSSVMRIDVDHPSGDKPYSIPADNPFVNTPGARGEVYAYGLRNPFRMNFDSNTGNLWLGDVGWELYESVYLIKPGANFGWSLMEGPNPVHPDDKRGPTEITRPQAAVPHSESASITGGLVYRGTKLPELYGHYIFADWQTSRFWAAKCTGKNDETLEPYREIAQTTLRPAAFIEDADREPLIVCHATGGIYRIVHNKSAADAAPFPRKLSETGLFASVKDQTPSPGVLAFTPTVQQWMDGASAERWVATPGTSKVVWGKGVWNDNKPKWPKDSVLTRTLSMEIRAGDAASKQRIETQLLHFDGVVWRGYSYAWNETQSDADLVAAGGDDRLLTISDPSAPTQTRRQMWHYPSRVQCMTCHSVWCDYTLAFTEQQLDHPAKFHTADGKEFEENAARGFKSLGLLLEPPPEPPPKRKPGDPPPEKLSLTDPYDPAASLNERARSYLHVNCSHCHRFGGGGTARIDLQKNAHLKDMRALDERPILGDFGLDDGRLICAGDPDRSVLLYRVSKLGRGRMPHIVSDRVDEKGIELLRNWIASLGKADEKIRERNESALRALGTPGESDAALKALFSSTSGALALLGAIQSERLTAEVRKGALEKAVSPATPELARDLFRRFDPREQQGTRLGANFNREKLLAIMGDAARGKKVFFAATADAATGLCAKCHRINAEGTAFGPELTHIGTKYNKSQLLEHIAEPSKTIADGFTTYVVKTTSGMLLTGLLVRKSDTEIVLKDAQKEHIISAADVQKMQPQVLSSMPEGLLSDLKAEDAADLLEYLSSLK